MGKLVGCSNEEPHVMTWAEVAHRTTLNRPRSHSERLVAGELDRYRFDKRLAASVRFLTPKAL